MRPKLAICSHLAALMPEMMSLGRFNGYTAVDYSLDERDLASLGPDLAAVRDMCGKSRLLVRYHLPFGDYEMAHRDPTKAADALTHFERAIDHVAADGGDCITVHMGLNSAVHGELDFQRGAENLNELVSYGAQRGVTVCLENLRTGFTSEPGPFMELVRASGAKVTFDVGHATSSDVAEWGFSAAEFARLVAPHVVNAHIYDREGPGHIAPKNLSNIREALEVLLGADCGWWVIELGDIEEVRRTRKMLEAFLEEHGS